MDPAPETPVPPLRREVELPHTRPGPWGPIAALTTIMFLTVAGAATLVVPTAHRADYRAWERARIEDGAARLQAELDALRVEIETAPPIRTRAIDARGGSDRAASPCRGPVYRAGADGQSEIVFEVCAGAPVPTEFVE